MVGRLVEQQEVRARGDDKCKREPPPLAAGQLDHGLVLLLPAREEEAPEEVHSLRPLQAGRFLCAVEHAAGLVQLNLVLREVGRYDAMAEPQRAGDRLAEPEQRLEESRLA